MTIRLTERELATVLAALRCWQQGLTTNEPKAALSPEHFDDTVTPLTAEEVDDLCERLIRDLFPGETARQLVSLTAPIQVWPPQGDLPITASALLGERYQSGDFVEITTFALVPASGDYQELRRPVTLMLTRTMIAAVQDVDPQSSGDDGDPSTYPL